MLSAFPARGLQGNSEIEPHVLLISVPMATDFARVAPVTTIRLDAADRIGPASFAAPFKSWGEPAAAPPPGARAERFVRLAERRAAHKKLDLRRILRGRDGRPRLPEQSFPSALDPLACYGGPCLVVTHAH